MHLMISIVSVATAFVLDKSEAIAKSKCMVWKTKHSFDLQATCCCSWGRNITSHETAIPLRWLDEASSASIRAARGKHGGRGRKEEREFGPMVRGKGVDSCRSEVSGHEWGCKMEINWTFWIRLRASVVDGLG